MAWSLVFDLQKRVVFIRSYKNKRVRHIALADLDFSCGTPVMMLDVHAEHAGNLAKHLQEYSHEVALRHALRAVAFHKPDMPEETVRKMLQRIESFPCTDPD